MRTHRRRGIATTSRPSTSSAHPLPRSTAALEEHAVAVTRAWQRKLFDAGFAGRSWPVEYGGRGGSQWEDDVVAGEQSQFGVSTKMFAVALEMLPAVLFAHGTHEQRLMHLPPVVRGEETWCQLLSEPDAGSDLANVRDAGETRCRWVVGDRPEGVDLGGENGGVRPPHRAQRSDVVASSWPVLLCAGHVRPGRDRAPAPTDVGWVSLQRGVPRPGACARGSIDRWPR